MELASQQQQSFPMIKMEALRYSVIKLSSILLGLCLIETMLFLYCYKVGISFFLTVTFLFIYLKTVNHRILIDLLYSRQQNRQDIYQYAIYDLSSNHNQNPNDRQAHKIYVVHTCFNTNNTKYFYFKEDLFKIQAQLVSRVTQFDIIQILSIQDFQTFARTGLNQSQLAISKQLFQPQKKYIHSNIYNFLVKRIYEQKEWVLLNTLFILICFIFGQLMAISIFLIIVNLLTLALIIYDQNKKVSQFTQKFAFLCEKTFTIFRQGQSKIVHLGQILVGDILQIEKTQQIEYLTYFKSLFTGNFQIICKQGQNNEQFIKSPIRTKADLNDDKKNRYIIKTLSYIEKASLRGNEHLIVLQNNCISTFVRYLAKFYHLWFNKHYYSQFYPIFREQTIKAIQLFLAGLIALAVIFFIISLIVLNNIAQPYQQTIVKCIFATILTVPSIMHLLLCLNHSKGIRELQKSEITMLGGDLVSAGCIQNIVINFEHLLQVQFQQILYKNLIFDPSSRPFQPDSATLESGRTYQSLQALILYISAGYLDEQENKPTFLRQIYKLYEDYFQLEDNLENKKDIVHKKSKRSWKILHKDFENQQGIRSWRVEYENSLKYIIAQCSVKDQKILTKYIGNEDKNKLNDYIELASNLMQEGKKIKLILFKNFRKEYTGIRGSQPSLQSQEEFIHMDRQQLQKNLHFAAFIIFDHAIKYQKLAILQQLRSMKNVRQKLFNLSIYSQNKNENLAGFEHILQYIPIYYSFQSHEKTSLIRQKMKEQGTIIFSQDIQDEYAVLLSDLSIKIQSSQISTHTISQYIVPSDLYLKNMDSIKDLLRIGEFNLKFKLGVIKYSFIVAFWMVFGLLWIGVYGKGDIVYSEIWVLAIVVFLILLPLQIKNQFFFNKTMVNYKLYTSIYTATFISQILLSLFISTLILIFVQQFPICSSANSQLQSHTLAFRMHYTAGNQTQQCMNVPLLLAGSASFLSFAVFYEESQASKFQFWKFGIVVIWLILMIVAQFPLKLILFCLGVIIFLVLIKILMKLAGRQTNKTQGNTSE